MNRPPKKFFTPESLDAIRSSRSLWIASAMSGIGGSFFAISTSHQFGQVPLVTFAWLYVALSFAVFLFAYFRSRLLQWQIIGLTLLVVLPYYPLIWANHTLLAQSGMLWVPFLGMKLIILTLAVTNPGPYWLNLLLLGGFAVESIMLWLRLHIGALPASVAAGEPWFTAMFFVVSAGLILFRWQNDILEGQLWAAELRSKILSRVAHLFLQVRDQSNTPLQQLILAVELLERGASTPQEQSEGMRRALHRLIELNQSFSKYNELIRWDGGELDPDKNLADQLMDVESEFLRDHISKLR